MMLVSGAILPMAGGSNRRSQARASFRRISRVLAHAAFLNCLSTMKLKKDAHNTTVTKSRR